MKVALVHDYLIKLGGAERVLKVLADMFPNAPIYTLLYDEDSVGGTFEKERVRASSLQKLPGFIRKKNTLLLTKFPRAIEEFDLSEFDLVIASSNSYAHGLVTSSNTLFVCYYHSPMRYIWDWYNEYFDDNGFGKLKRGVAKWLLHKIRIWDQLAAERPDIVVANSTTVKDRISKYYKREAEVIYPPVDLARFKPVAEIADYFLIVSTLTPYKRVDLAVEFFNKVGKKLIIVGEGKDKERLMAMAGPSIEFKGGLSDVEVANMMAECRGFIFPGEEDFGITPVEAMAAGRPVFAYGKGGVTETVIDKKTGMFFDEPTIESFETGFAKFLSFEKKFFKPEDAIKRAKDFSVEKFEKSLRKLVDQNIDM